MPAGRPKKSIEILKLTGNYRKDRHGDGGPVPTGKPVKPARLKARKDKYASDHWDHNVPLLVELGIATDADQHQLEAMCSWWSEYRRALEGQHEDRLQLMNTAFTQWQKCASKFGLSPTDRRSLEGSKQPPKNVFGELKRLQAEVGDKGAG